NRGRGFLYCQRRLSRTSRFGSDLGSRLDGGGRRLAGHLPGILERRRKISRFCPASACRLYRSSRRVHAHHDESGAFYSWQLRPIRIPRAWRLGRGWIFTLESKKSDEMTLLRDVRTRPLSEALWKNSEFVVAEDFQSPRGLLQLRRLPLSPGN